MAYYTVSCKIKLHSTYYICLALRSLTRLQNEAKVHPIAVTSHFYQTEDTSTVPERSGGKGVINLAGAHLKVIALRLTPSRKCPDAS
jgi:hypothetical protein